MIRQIIRDALQSANAHMEERDGWDGQIGGITLDTRGACFHLNVFSMLAGIARSMEHSYTVTVEIGDIRATVTAHNRFPDMNPDGIQQLVYSASDVASAVHAVLLLLLVTDL